MKENKRPFGLSAIIVLQMLNVLSLVGIFYIQSTSDLFTQDLNLVDFSLISTFVQIGSMLLLAVALPGVWFFKRWGWLLLMFQLGISLSIGIWQFFGQSTNFVMMAFNVASVFYLNQREVQRLFEASEKEVEQTEAWI
ncbi:MAG: hypothetical protein AAF490_05980 [Chloroflexota bacterium]